MSAIASRWPARLAVALALEAFLGTHPRYRQPGLALFTPGSRELRPGEPVDDGDELVLLAVS